MKSIHGKLTVDKVDQTMYVAIIMFLEIRIELLTIWKTGTNYANRTP